MPFKANKQFIKIKTAKHSLLGLSAKFRNLIQESLKKYQFNKDELAVINALLLGQRQDISKELIEYCKRNYHQNWVKFFRGSRPLKDLDFCVISGAFNLSATKIYSEWEDHIFSTLSDCWQKTNVALVFNLQTNDTPHVSKGSIFYGDKQVIASRCNSLFGNTSHLHSNQLPHDTTFIIKRE